MVNLERNCAYHQCGSNVEQVTVILNLVYLDLSIRILHLDDRVFNCAAILRCRRYERLNECWVALVGFLAEVLLKILTLEVSDADSCASMTRNLVILLHYCISGGSRGAVDQLWPR